MVVFTFVALDTLEPPLLKNNFSLNMHHRKSIKKVNSSKKWLKTTDPKGMNIVAARTPYKSPKNPHSDNVPGYHGFRGHEHGKRILKLRSNPKKI
jgi:hypothetical protein